MQTNILVHGIIFFQFRRIHLETSDDEKYLSIDLTQRDGEYALLSVNVTDEYKLINHKDDAKTITMKVCSNDIYAIFF